IGYRQTKKVEHGGPNIDEPDRLGELTGRNHPPKDEQGDVNELLVKGLAVEGRIVFAERFPVVRAHDEHSVMGIGPLQSSPHPTYPTVDPFHFREIASVCIATLLLASIVRFVGVHDVREEKLRGCLPLSELLQARA